MRLRPYMKDAVAHAVHWSGLAAMARARRHRRTPFVAAYHRVVDRLGKSQPFALPAMEISAATLERQLDWIAAHYRLVSLEELPAASYSRSSKPIAAVTFDDGYRDVFDHAFPMLKRKGIPAAMFVITDLVGTRMLPVHERLHAALVAAEMRSDPKIALNVPPNARDPFSATRFLLATLSAADVEKVIDDLDPDRSASDRLKGLLRPLTWPMLAEMQKAGMTIGSHSKTHPFLSNENESKVTEETRASREELQRRLGSPVRCFAYPGGSFDSRTVSAVAAAGYELGFTICGHRHRRYPALTIPRTGLWEQACVDPAGRFSTAVMSCQAAGTFRPLSPCRQRH